MTQGRLRLHAGVLPGAATVAARLLLVFLALWALDATVKHLSYVVIPVFVALLITALLEPVVGWLVTHRWPRRLAVFATVVLAVIVIGGIATFVVLSVINSWDELRQKVSASLAQLQQWLSQGPLHITGGLLERAQRWLMGNQSTVLTQALGAFTTVGAIAVGLLLAIVLTLMFLGDGPKMWAFLLLPWRPETREIVDDAGRRAFRGVVLYVRVTALVALIDAIGIGIGLAIVGVPLAVPLSALVFVGAFIPIVGAVVSGFLAVAVTLVSNGLVPALIVLGVVLAVQQLEGNVLHPLLQGSFSRLHPAVVLVALVIGGAEGGIAGALLAVPVLAAARGVLLAILDRREREAARQPPEDGEDPDGSAGEPEQPD
jgi:predicted PurR-regulated permease PerM